MPELIRAVFFDLGGVVLDSPFETFARFESSAGLAHGAVARAVVAGGDTGAWARHERGEIDREQFVEAFGAELAEAGANLDVDRLLDEVDGALRVRPRMLGAVRALRAESIRVAAITNNWIPFGSSRLVSEFDVFLESVVEGVRKPEPEIYLRCLRRVGVPAHEVLMLDDLGPNLAPARELGMATVKVTSEDQALGQLREYTGVQYPAPRRSPR